MKTFDDFYKRFVTNKKSRNELSQELDNALKAIFREFPEIMSITSYGYTPGFNDGDPCTHRASYMCFPFKLPRDITGAGWILTESLLELADAMSCREDNPLANVPDEELRRIDKDSRDRFKKPIRLLNELDMHFQQAYETNWGIVVNRIGDDSFEIHHEWVEPGY